MLVSGRVRYNENYVVTTAGRVLSSPPKRTPPLGAHFLLFLDQQRKSHTTKNDCNSPSFCKAPKKKYLPSHPLKSSFDFRDVHCGQQNHLVNTMNFRILMTLSFLKPPANHLFWGRGETHRIICHLALSTTNQA